MKWSAFRNVRDKFVSQTSGRLLHTLGGSERIKEATPAQ